MKRRILIVGHSDADGHVIAEQTRRNLSAIPTFDVRVVVDPKRTQSHKAWLHLDSLRQEIEPADIVFFVDMMFGPVSYVSETQALVKLANLYTRKRFFVMDHHPLPQRRLSAAGNIRVAYRPNVADCTFGPRSGLMVLAALCEKQDRQVEEILTPDYRTLVLGLRRAAAPGGGLAGPTLLNLLQADRWDLIFAVGKEDKASHQNVRGIRLARSEPSPALAVAAAAGQEKSPSIRRQKSQYRNVDSSGGPMPFDVGAERFVLDASEEAPILRNAPILTRDLEAIVTLLEVAAISLTNTPDATFSRGELISEAREIAGTGIEFDERDVDVVLEKATFVKAIKGKQFVLR
jgi:hypothetical protein